MLSNSEKGAGAGGLKNSHFSYAVKQMWAVAISCALSLKPNTIAGRLVFQFSASEAAITKPQNIKNGKNQFKADKFTCLM